MMILVTGGSGSGKSAYAEDRLLSFPEKDRIYLATMAVWDEESRRRIARHLKLREGKNFRTLECPVHIGDLAKKQELCGANVLLEDLSNLLANEMFSEEKRGPEEVLGDVKLLADACANLVIVSNEIFSDAGCWDEGTEAFLSGLGFLNRQLAGLAEETVEVVYGLPLICRKGGLTG